MLTNFMNKINGYKTYITLVVGLVITILGHFWGPTHIGPVDVPAIDTASTWKTVWEILVAIFIRHGITKAQA